MHFTRILANASEPPAMGIVRQLLKLAMKSGNAVEKTTLRAVMSAVKNADIAKPGSLASNVAFGGLLSSLIKKRLQSISEYTAGNRHDLADNEKSEMAVLEKLLNELKLANPEEIKANALKFIEQLKLTPDMKDGFKVAMSKLPKDIEEQWRAPKSAVVNAMREHFGSQKRDFSTFAPVMKSRAFSTSALRAHENPLGLRRRSKPTAQSGGGLQKKRIPLVERVILVSSAKGGVGKSTVAVNLALSLQEKGFSAGILDADIFGPSVPKMLGMENVGEPRLTADGSRLLPMVGLGLRAMSMGFLIPADKAVSWRGLLVQKALHQLLFEVEWGALQYLIVDMPPGTGDIQLTMGQQLAVDGAIIVSTPQQVAQIDAQRGIDMFTTLKIPVLGYVENMAHFTCPCCNTQTRLFGPKPELPIAKIGEIPLEPAIAAQADAGTFESRQAYLDLADNVVARLNVHK